MKKTILFCLPIILFIACTEVPKNAPATTTATAVTPVLSDSAAITDVIHGFYKWYNTFSTDSTKSFDFTNDKGKHLTLDMPKLEKHLAEFKATGFVSAEFVENDRTFYKKCEKIWQKEEIGDIPSGMDADKYFCAQDWEIDFWTKSPIRIKPLGADKVAATMYGTEGGGKKEHNFELKKENDKWLLTKIECDMGIK